jgi:predicted transcriptional regulator
MEHQLHEMNIESLKHKIDNQSRIIKELTKENEELYHQYNHLIIRNGKMLKRIDDFQKIIDDLHIRIEELQLINGNMMQLNDKLRKRRTYFLNDNNEKDDIKTDELTASERLTDEFNLEELYGRWKEYPGQVALNAPNLRKQILMLVHLYKTSSLRASELFSLTGVGGVTGARYVSTLKKFGLIHFTGARKKGHYEITYKGKSFIENSLQTVPFSTQDYSKFSFESAPQNSKEAIPHKVE